MNFYNDTDPKACAWLRELIRAGEIPPSDVDERSITDIQPHEFHGYTQCHFFAGIAGWSLALKLAGWPEDRPVWTGSCPCQPLSCAGSRKGHADERHLWPAFYRLISECRPATVFGEQVASADGREWLAGIRADMEGVGYAVGAADMCAAGVGAPHIRQRIYWVANAGSNRRDKQCRNSGSETETRASRRVQPVDGCDIGRVADPDGRESGDRGLQRGGGYLQQPENETAGGLGDAHDAGPQGRDERRHGSDQWTPWTASMVLPCTDGKARRIEPGSFPLAHGIPGRVGLLRGYGNAIVPPLAAKFIEAAMTCL